MLSDEQALAKAEARAQARKAHAGLEAIIASLEDVAAEDEDADAPKITEADFRAQEAEDEAQSAYEARCRARAQAEDDWVENVVAEQEAKATAKAQARTNPIAHAASATAATNATAPADADATADRAWAMALEGSGVRLSRSNSMGRGLVAARDARPGDVLLRAPAASAVLLGGCSGSHCHHCLQAMPSLKVCSACKHARYCCAEHQRAAWTAHRSE